MASNSTKYTWLIGPLITIISLVAGFGVGWGAVQSKLTAQEVSIVELRGRVSSSETRIRDIELTSVSVSTQLVQVQKTLDEIKEDVKEALSK